MSLFFWYIIFSSMVILLINSWMVYKIKHTLSKMAAMMYAMYIGMNVGLTAGLIFGAAYKGNLFYSTVLSLSIAVLVGLMIGIQMGILPTIESIMAAVMGGMMGAMLGEMISIAESTVLIKIFFTLTISSILLLLALSETRENSKVINGKWLIKPLFIVVVIVLILMGGQFLEKKQLYNLADEPHQHLNSLTITTNNFNYTPSTIKLEKGKKVTLTLHNSDQVEHDLEIKSIQMDSPSNQHNHGQKADLHIHAKANSSNQLTFTPQKSGTYQFYCTIPGHKESGMVGTLIVY
ncbi:hypothetical protein GCM10008967_21610 [Bacillus carboniphilus]|uniref:EfeO-type cupredoxin-like domain-containing protein n=1 Tax=Bacillus carboniphilus TaxID=86663 RepID=A0ABN0WAB6_9BACI